MQWILLSGMILLLTACSQKFNDVNDTLNLAFWGERDTTLNQSDIDLLPYASIYARVNNGAQAFIVLAFAERPFHTPPAQHNTTLNALPLIELKWLSADRAMLVTAEGRIVKTHNLPAGNIVATNGALPDPLSLGLHLPSTPKTWQRTLDWQPGYHFGYTLQSQFKELGHERITLNEKPTEAIHYIEEVTVESLAFSFQNDFWLHPVTGKVLKSRQMLAPGLPYVEITLLKPFSS